MDDSDPRLATRVEPLSAQAWFAELQKIRASAPRASDDVILERALRKSFFLAHLAPDPMWESICPMYDEGVFEDTLEMDGIDAAAQLLITPRLTLSCMELSGIYTVSIRDRLLPNKGECMSDHRARAILFAWIDCALGANKDAINRAVKSATITRLVPRRFRSE